MRTYLVTGSANGIGLATRTLLEAQGDRVIGVDLDDAEICLDLSNPEERLQLADRVMALGLESLDGVLPSAGVGGAPHPPETVLRLNYFGAVSTVNQMKPLLATSAAPRVCMIASIGLLAPDCEIINLCLAGEEEEAVRALSDPAVAPYPPYAATKRAIAYWVRRNGVSDDWLRDRILINAVAPGLIATNMTAALTKTAATLEATFARFPQPLGVGQPMHVASLIAYLLSQANGFIAGQTIFVDGGHEALVGPRIPPVRPAI